MRVDGGLLPLQRGWNSLKIKYLQRLIREEREGDRREQQRCLLLGSFGSNSRDALGGNGPDTFGRFDQQGSQFL